MSADPAAAEAPPGGALILAAGASRRFGSDKRRHTLPDGTPMMIATLACYRRAFDRLVLVLRPEDDDLARDAERAAPGLEVVRAADARLGMGHSLAAGIRRVEGRWQYCCVALADMPFVRPDTLEALRDAWLAAEGDTIIQPVFDGQPGHPVVFGACYFPEIGRLTGDEGARSVIRAHQASVRRLALADPGVIRDLDRPPEARQPTTGR